MTELPCPACGQTVTTGAAPGKTITCKRCRSELRVPLREVAAPRTSVTCGACAAAFETTTPPGRPVPCKACGAEVRVPLRDAGAPRRAVTCPACAAVFETPTPPGKKTRCRACQAEVRVPLREPQALVEFPCAVCGETTRSTELGRGKQSTCRACGATIRVPLAGEEVVPIDPAFLRACPACGERVRADRATCEACGVDMEVAKLDAQRGPEGAIAATVTIAGTAALATVGLEPKGSVQLVDASKEELEEQLARSSRAWSLAVIATTLAAEAGLWWSPAWLKVKLVGSAVLVVFCAAAIGSLRRRAGADEEHDGR